MHFPWQAKDSNRVGQQAEDLALNFLTQQGLSLVARNFRCRAGEIDLIMRDHQCLTFIEVRYRKSSRFGGSAESVTHQKQQKIIRCAEYYLHQEKQNRDQDCRFDVIAIYPSDTGQSPLQFDWIKDAFQTHP